MDRNSSDNTNNKDSMFSFGGVERSESTKSGTVLIKEEKDDDHRCGCGPCTPSWLQRFKGVKFFTFITLIGLLSKVYASSYFGAVVSTLERQFHLNSANSGLLLVINDIMDFTFVIFVTHFGHRGHRPRWVATGLLMAALGCFLCTIPHIMIKYVSNTNNGQNPKNLCLRSPNPAGPNQDLYENITYIENMISAGQFNSSVWINVDEFGPYSSVWSSVMWLMLGQALIGIGNTPLKPLATTYIDDSVEDHKTGFYVAMLFLATPIGAIAGYFTSFISLKFYVDFDRVPLTEWPRIPESDPRWIGAWWVGFAVAAVLLGLSALPFFFFPKHPHICRRTSISENPKCMNVRQRPQRKKSVKELIKGLLQALKRMFTNPAMVFICLSASASSAAYAVSGAFGIKYFVDEFGKSNSSASMVGTILPILIMAYIVGGYVIKRFKWSARQCALFGLIVDAPSCLMYFFLIFVGCPTSDVAGVSVPYNLEPVIDMPINITDACNYHCECPEQYSYDPVCINKITYVSPCHAGCTVVVEEGRGKNKIKQYSNCSCVDPGVEVENGACPIDEKCNFNFLIAVILILIALGTSSLGRSADIIVTLRCVEKQDRSLALGIKIFLVNILAFFPAPVYFGALLNWSCLEFAYKPNGEEGACLIYDRTRYRYVYYGMYTALHLCGLFCWFMVFLTVKEKNKGSQTEDEDTNGHDHQLEEVDNGYRN
ncbi:solute carrier organic anion transporter family member 2A1-like isoform X2 [Anneissia japonica]|uniref:solute carrier organic anion transporter family member 2A1-like isoform X2 n=1 Tax=Anneissia japonica TaxID=1529436 RepID=UPI001425A6BD|nr:solute carrier organic anion transporter family member 2A1-like isoform X2 [Anneissia japonica]